MAKISVIGLGSWGTALSLYLNKNNHEVILYGRMKDNLKKIKDTRIHQFLPNIKIPQNINITNNLEKTLKNEWIVLAVPSYAIRKTLKKIVDSNFDKIKSKKIINVAKGMEIKTSKRISEIVYEESKGFLEYVVLSGPTHAEEISKNKLAAVVVASKNKNLAKKVQIIFNSKIFRVYRTDDVIGVELGGILKNIIAIAAGFIDGLKLGDNAKAALLTRGIQEMVNLGKFLGAKEETFRGLSGIGDLIATCTSKHSRNRMFGENFSKNNNFKTQMIVEGLYATKAIYELAKKRKIIMPITEEVYKILYRKKDILLSILNLMNRKLKIEMEVIENENY